MKNHKQIIDFIKELYVKTGEFIPLHAPHFAGNEKKYVNECIDSTFVSSVGKFVDEFEAITAKFTGAKYAVATVNGTAALHIALLLAELKPDEEVITQSLTFVATANAIKHANATPVFIDVDRDTLGLSPEKLEHFLKENTVQKINKLTNKHQCFNKTSGRFISACVPMHTFGHPCRIEEIAEITRKHNITLVEDSAESLGSYYKGKHTGTFGKLGVFSYNGNKTITAGGGGMIVTDDLEIAKKAKHITTTAKIPDPVEFIHDEIGYNYRLTNINAALGLAQMERIDSILSNKRETAHKYAMFFKSLDINFITEPVDCHSNYWLNALQFSNATEKNEYLETMNSHGIMTRPIWRLMNKLEMFKNCQTGDLNNSESLEQTIVNIPSSYRI